MLFHLRQIVPFERIATVTWDALVSVRDTLNQAIEHEQASTLDDALFLTLQHVKTDANRDIARRLAQVEKTVTCTPETVLPALVLAAAWYMIMPHEKPISPAEMPLIILALYLLNP